MQETQSIPQGTQRLVVVVVVGAIMYKQRNCNDGLIGKAVDVDVGGDGR
jgi:hypothetical protein